MPYAVRTTEHAWPVRFYVESGEAVVPGMPIVDVTLGNGVVETLKSDRHGIVAAVEDNHDRLFKPGEMLCHIVARSDRNSRQKGLVPKPSTYQRFLRFGR